MEEKKKSTYNPKAQKKYNEKFKFITCKIEKTEAEKIKLHADNKGFKSLNSYIIDLIKKDMQL